MDESFIADSFNLYGLEEMLPIQQFAYCYDIILDYEINDDIDFKKLENSVVKLYGLIHARYIVTTQGLEAMV